MPLDGGGAPNFLSIQDLLVAFYGGALVTQPIESDFTIGTTATALKSTATGLRIGVLLSNTGTANFAVSFNPAVTITTGILLLQGGTLKLDWYYDGDLVERPLFAVAAAAGGTIHMLERYLTGS